MRGSIGTLVAASMGVFACVACTVPLDDQGQLEDESIGSVQQALEQAEIERVQVVSGSGVVVAACPPELPRALGNSFSTAAQGLNALYYDGGFFPSEVVAEKPNLSGTVTVTSVCSNAFGLPRTKLESDGDAFANCFDGEVAVGGGGICSTASAKLYRSRPSPDVNGSEPTAWRASCTTGAVETWALCVDENFVYDFTQCRTKRVDKSSGVAQATCDIGDFVVTVGAYCASPSPGIAWTDIATDHTNASAVCLGSGPIHLYAVCCDNVEL